VHLKGKKSILTLFQFYFVLIYIYKKQTAQ